MVHRHSGETGECGIAAEVLVSSVGLHHGEERPISGSRGSGTIFFSGCNLHCVFCQNWTISQERDGEPMSPPELADVMLSLQRAGAHNINWVSPTHVVPMLIEALLLARKRGLTVPLVYNTGGYDSLDVLHLLDGLVDVYMPDMKYGDPEIGKRLSGVEDYPEHNQAAVSEMYRQVGPLVCDEQGVASRGLLVRHLVLPNGLAGSERVFDFLASRLPGPVHVNVMNQYRPAHLADSVPELARPTSAAEFREALDAARCRPSIHLIN